MATTSHNDLELLGGSPTAHYVLASSNEYHLPPQLATASSTPQHDMTVAKFAATDPILPSQMWNRSKKCPACKKINALTMVCCNGCGASLTDTPESATENVPMGFVYGVAKTSNFPLKLSLRLEEPSTLVYDDPLARATCHMNAIPTDVHLPDWRWLLTRPDAAIELLKRLEDAAWRAVETNYYNFDGWRTSVLREGSCPTSAELKPHCIAALNAVVSQYQLHMHYIVPPLRPDSYHSLIIGKRFEKGRWLPLSYVYAALEALVASGAGLPEAPTMETADLFQLIESKGGPNYDAAYDAEINRNARSHEALSNWRASAFEGVSHAVQSTTATYELKMASTTGEAAEADIDVAAALKRDTTLLSSYGWQSEGESRAPMSYYSFAKSPSDVLTSIAWSKGGGGAA